MTRQPALFLSHGSPMTAIDDGELRRSWQSLAERLSPPDAVVMVSAHWTTAIPILGGSATPETVHDFYGFPAQLYQLRYPAPGAPELALRIKSLLADDGIAAAVDPRQGLDHGAWIPLLTLFPDARVPVMQLSVQPDRGARHHWAVGQALRSLSEDNVLVIGSGHMTHNLRDYFVDRGRVAPQTRVFRDWAHEQLLEGRIDSLLDWPHEGPHAALAHPTPEHFLPLFVALGAAGDVAGVEHLGGGTLGGALAADNYLFTSA